MSIFFPGPNICAKSISQIFKHYRIEVSSLYQNGVEILQSDEIIRKKGEQKEMTKSEVELTNVDKIWKLILGEYLWVKWEVQGLSTLDELKNPRYRSPTLLVFFCASYPIVSDKRLVPLLR